MKILGATQEALLLEQCYAIGPGKAIIALLSLLARLRLPIEAVLSKEEKDSDLFPTPPA